MQADPTVSDNLPRDAALLETASLSAALSSVDISPVSLVPTPRAH